MAFKNRNLGKFFTLLKAMVRRGVEPDVHAYGLVLRALVSSWRR
jgi:pentatricopeptide repeat protein